MAERNEIVDLIPMLAQGKLDKAHEDRLLAAIEADPALAAELEFWKGVNSIRREMPRYDFGEHLDPELLDRFVRGRIDSYSPEFSRVSAHLQQCSACTEDLELVRNALKSVPEDRLYPAASREKGWLTRLLSLFSSPRPALAALIPLVVIVIVAFSAFSPWGDLNNTMSILLRPQFEKRNIAADGRVPEYEFHLRSGVDKIAFQFVTDRLDLVDYRYSISLTPAGGAPIRIGDEAIDCSQTELSNRCQVTVSDPALLSLLHHGGSFSISIHEELPAGTDLEPAEYEYYFHVLTDN